MEKLIETLFNGISMGAIYALIALGFVLVYKATDILNFANGELVMFGAFSVIPSQQCLTSHISYPFWSRWPLVPYSGQLYTPYFSGK